MTKKTVQEQLREKEPPQLGKDLQFVKDATKMDLPLCTYMIPLRVETPDRMRNIITVLLYFLKNINAPIIVKEFDNESIYEASVLPQIRQVATEEELSKITHVFEQSDEFTFHRTRLINDMIEMADTEFVCNYDCDVLLPFSTHFYANTFLAKGYLPPDSPEGTPLQPVKVVYPYGYGMFQQQVFADDKTVSNFINSNFNFHAFDGKMRAYDAKFGFCQFFNRKEYIRLGMENENFISYGYEDDERYHRFNMCSDVVRVNDIIFHLEHKRSDNSWFTNPHIENNRKEWEKLKFYGKDKIEEYYQNIHYMKRRFGQEQK
jgi:hypothetical protein|tara:strand:+ start:93 stop:1046 length:954 start_codon:yes stop_codon:yes gene_type:complete